MFNMCHNIQSVNCCEFSTIPHLVFCSIMCLQVLALAVENASLTPPKVSDACWTFSMFLQTEPVTVFTTCTAFYTHHAGGSSSATATDQPVLQRTISIGGLELSAVAETTTLCVKCQRATRRQDTSAKPVNPNSTCTSVHGLPRNLPGSRSANCHGSDELISDSVISRVYSADKTGSVAFVQFLKAW